MSTIFISHSSKDQKVARAICAALESRGLNCWLASRDVGAGDNFQESIVRAIQSAKVMVLVFTENANNSAEIKKELALASQNKLAVIPARAEDVVPTAALAYELATRQWINLFQDWEHEIENLCARVRQIVPPPSPEAAPPRPPVEPIAETVSRPVAPAAKQPTAARAVPLWLALVFTTFGVARLGLSSIFLTAMPSWNLTSYLLAADALITALMIVIAGTLLMVTARWAIATAVAICIVALLHDAAWLGAWYLVHSRAGAEAVVFHFGPMVACVTTCVCVLLIQIWRQTAEFRRGLGRQRGLAQPATEG